MSRISNLDIIVQRVVTLAEVLHAVSPNDAIASRIFCDSRLRRMTDGTGLQYKWPRTSTIDKDDQECIDPGWIVLVLDRYRLGVAFDLSMYPALSVLAENSMDDHGYLHDSVQSTFRVLLASSLLSDLTDQLEASGYGAWKITSISRRAPSWLDAANEVAPVTVDINVNGVTHRARVTGSSGMLAAIKRQIGRGPDAISGLGVTSYGHVLLSGKITLGFRTMTIDTLRSLQPGDVVLRVFDAASTTALLAGSPLVSKMFWGHPSLVGICANVQICRTEMIVLQEPWMSSDPNYEDFKSESYILEPSPAPVSEEAFSEEENVLAEGTSGDFRQSAEAPGDGVRQEPLSIGELELPVHFEIETRSFSLSQISSFGVGYVVELKCPIPEAPVRLVTAGQMIGEGELVAVGNHLGVRIRRMAHDDASV
jgi:type III secretion protein Q